MRQFASIMDKASSSAKTLAQQHEPESPVVLSSHSEGQQAPKKLLLNLKDAYPGQGIAEY